MQVQAAVRMTLYQVGVLEPASQFCAAPAAADGVARMWLTREHLNALCTVLHCTADRMQGSDRNLAKVCVHL